MEDNNNIALQNYGGCSMNICYKEIKSDELQDDMLIYHNRYQYVQNDWYPDKNGGYYLVHQPHVENWDDNWDAYTQKSIFPTCMNVDQTMYTWNI